MNGHPLQPPSPSPASPELSHLSSMFQRFINAVDERLTDHDLLVKSVTNQSNMAEDLRELKVNQINTIREHEERIRKLENWQYKMIGISSVCSGIGGTLVYVLLHGLGNGLK
jgi:hypothetical protein